MSHYSSSSLPHGGANQGGSTHTAPGGPGSTTASVPAGGATQVHSVPPHVQLGAGGAAQHRMQMQQQQQSVMATRQGVEQASVQIINNVKNLRLAVRHAFYFLSTGMGGESTTTGEGTSEDARKVKIKELSVKLKSLHDRYVSLEKLSQLHLSVHPLPVVSEHLNQVITESTLGANGDGSRGIKQAPGTSEASISSMSTSLYAALLPQLDWADALLEQSRYAHTFLAKRVVNHSQPLFSHNLLTGGKSGAVPSQDFLASALRAEAGAQQAHAYYDRVLCDMVAQATRSRRLPNLKLSILDERPGSIVLQITVLSRQLVALFRVGAVVRAFMPEWLVVKSAHENMRDTLGNLTLGTTSVYSVFRQMSDYMNSVLLNHMTHHDDVIAHAGTKGNHPGPHVEALAHQFNQFLMWLDRYKWLYTEPCTICNRILKDGSPPYQLAYKAVLMPQGAGGNQQIAVPMTHPGLMYGIPQPGTPGTLPNPNATASAPQFAPVPISVGNQGASGEAQQLANTKRFHLELEFVQCLANPHYLNFLAQRDYFKEDSFRNYLKYLLYWKRPQYCRYLKYPQCLRFLELLQYEEFTEALKIGSAAQFIEEQQILQWQYYLRKRQRLQTINDTDAERLLNQADDSSTGGHSDVDDHMDTQ